MFIIRKRKENEPCIPLDILLGKRDYNKDCRASYHTRRTHPVTGRILRLSIN